METKRVLVVGGTGYLGQHLLLSLSQIKDNAPYDLAFTYHSNSNLLQPLLDAIPQSLAFHVDLVTGDGFQSIASKFGLPHVVVNCAALSVPRVCEKDPDAAMSINVPNSLVNWLSSFEERDTLLIHLSTDQVYEGSWPNFAILRSSIIFGPQTISPVPKSLPIQWIDGVLSKKEQVEFFHDEFRCPVYVKDVVTIILSLINKWVIEGKQMKLLLNVGGPDRVSRVQMAETVAHVRGYSTSLIKQVSASSVYRGSLIAS
ncbi:hypothetical protein OIU84_016058 [Salix udensis]|uniref:RmlD-like substrate binding domain-containing protein n=1 Tax=Salix udensis TaxID=889485 RepID=A0AAD6J9E5_9ROSI|nr:hypothetical protein OIU84_016058 [Salix udensis]